MDAPSGYTNIEDVFYEIHLPKKDSTTGGAGFFEIDQDVFQCFYWIGFNDKVEGATDCTLSEDASIITTGRSVDPSKDILAFMIDGLINP